MAASLLVPLTILVLLTSVYSRNEIVIATVVAILATHTAVVFLPWLSPASRIKVPEQRGPTRLMIILGSGGHTSEMFMLLKDLDCKRYSFRSYVVSSGDDFSVGRAHAFEKDLSTRFVGELYGSYDVSVVPRARRVHQSLVTAPLTSVQCMLSCFRILRSPANKGAFARSSAYPHLIISNGPGTGVVVIMAALLLQLLGIADGRRKGCMRTIYVESWARVRRLSLSGRILLPFVDRFVVQWETLLKATGKKGEFLGSLVI